MRAIWSGSRPPRTSRRATPTAPPYQIAATPIAPQANPGRSRYQPVGPTGAASASSKVTGPLVTSERPRANQAVGSTATPFAGPSGTAYNRRVVLPSQAVTSACERVPASEHHGLVPDRRV